MQKRPWLLRFLVFLSILAIFSGAAIGCSGGGGREPAHTMKMAPLSDMPAEVQAAPVTVQQAYQFAVANPDVLAQLPCYCGCGQMGHTSNYACYVSGEDAAGKPAYDSHALGCSICVDITLDAMRLLKQDKALPEIRSYVDSTYAQYGPSNIP